MRSALMIAAVGQLACGSSPAPTTAPLENQVDSSEWESHPCSADVPGGERRATTLTAHLLDAAGLPIGTQVNRNDVPIGEVTKLELIERGGTTFAKVTIVFRPSLEVFSNAELRRTASELLGASMLELDPGRCPPPARSISEFVVRLKTGDRIPNVVEPPADAILKRLEDATQSGR